ncbi:MAG: ATP-binding protein [Pseudomonadota bacterium]
MSKSYPSMSINIDSRFENVRLVSNCIAAVCEQIFDETTVSEMKLAFVEAVNNCIEHAYEFKAGGDITINVALSETSLSIDIEDRGITMPAGTLDAAPDEIKPDINDFDSLPEGGMGITILKTVMDKVTYTSEDGRNLLHLVKAHDKERCLA